MERLHFSDNIKLQNYSTEGFACIDWSISSAVQELRSSVDSILWKYFYSSDHWKSMSSIAFDQYAYECQSEINSIGFQKRFLSAHCNIIKAYTNISALSHESVVFLRAIRPLADVNRVENIDFHRETMYTNSPVQTSTAHNIWIPLNPCTKGNALMYYPSSHLIPDKELVFSYPKASYVQKGSFGHKTGKPYAPKSILSGLEGLSPSPMLPSPDQFCLFSAMTIHGGGVNRSEDIRLSLSMALIDSDNITDNKQYIAANGSPHYQQFN